MNGPAATCEPFAEVELGPVCASAGAAGRIATAMPAKTTITARAAMPAARGVRLKGLLGVRCLLPAARAGPERGVEAGGGLCFEMAEGASLPGPGE
jgi:hypothetical protein